MITWRMKMNKKRMVYIIIAAVILVPIIGLRVMSALATKPENLGVTDGKMAPCPDSPNCVSSQATNDKHRMEPIPFEGSADEAIKNIKAALAEIPRTTIVTEKENYIHAEATSLLFRFVDDVEFYVDSDANVIHFRSASRVGYSDMGANRKRMTKIREAIVGTHKK